MRNGKYLTFTDGTAIVFPQDELHSMMVGRKTVRSAGFFYTVPHLTCFGQSTSLQVRALQGDEALIRTLVSLMPHGGLARTPGAAASETVTRVQGEGAGFATP
jgi:hypothetical protein